MNAQTPLGELQGCLESLGPVAMTIRNEADPIEVYQQRLQDLRNEMAAIVATAEEDNARDLTEDEMTQIAHIRAEFDDVEKQLKARSLIVAADHRVGEAMTIGQPTGRVTQPDGAPVDPEPEPEPDPAPAPTPRQPTAQGAAPSATRPRWDTRARVEPQPINHAERGRNGFRHVGDFCMSVRNAYVSGMRNIDERLRIRGAAATTFGTEGTGADGGFAVPPEFRRDIVTKVFAEDSLIARTDLNETASNTFHTVKDETTPWQTTGGIQAFWEGEAAAMTQSKPQLTPSGVRLHKLTALVAVTDEMLEDAVSLESHIRTKAPEKIDFKLSNGIFDGTGAGQPQGILSSPSLVTVAKEAGQSADTLVFKNISKMYSRMYAPCRMNAVWLINQDIEEQLDELNHPGDSRPVYMPANGLAGAPHGTIKGRPVVPHEVCKTLGDKGDIILADLSKYMSVQKTTGLRAETSIHLWFDQDLTAFKFVLRVAGQPWWNTAITPFNGSNTLSCFVALAERA